MRGQRFSGPKPRTDNSINDIERFVAHGHAQSAGNCRVLLDKIAEQGREINRLRKALREAQAQQR